MNNSEDANRYYQLINKYIDDYLDNWKISPKNLKKYLSTDRISKFLERKGLKEIKNIGRVIDDIIQDRISLENEMVVKFESFMIFEGSEISTISEDISQCLYRGIEKSNIDHEKIIADHYDISLSQIDIIDTNIHKFRVEGDEQFIIYKEDELEIIKENLTEWASNRILHKTIKINLGNKEIDIPISKISDQENLKKIIESEVQDVRWIISSILKCKSFDKNSKYFIGIL
jgi:hypothetical protein